MTRDALREDCLSRALLLLKRGQPFFATLSLFADYQWREEIPTAATDGRRILLNPDWYCALPPAQRGGILLHEILHAIDEQLDMRLKHRQVHALAVAIMQVLRENDDLVGFLTASVKDSGRK